MIVDAPASGRTLATRKLVEYGAVDALLAAERFLDESIAWAHRVLQGEEIVARPDVNRDQEHWQMAIERSRDAVDKRLHSAWPAPYRALDLLSDARALTREQGFAAEDEALGDMAMTDECRAALYAFQLTRARSRNPAGAPDATLAAQSARSASSARG